MGDRDYSIKVLGRTLEHLGVQMYKRRDTAIAELVANCHDARAQEVRIVVPDDAYDPDKTEITITDTGNGMNPDEVQDNFLIVGRNRRTNETFDPSWPVMGRKGIGKLAGFGIASQMTVQTWREGKSTTFTLDADKLKTTDGETHNVPIRGVIGPVPSFAETDSGTRITLKSLKHKTPINIDALREALSRRFSRRVREKTRIYVNGDPIGDPNLDLDIRYPNDGYLSELLPDGTVVRYFYGFSKGTIRSSELRGFTVYVRGKTAQAPPFFFNVEGTASGQHSTKYVVGAIEADFLDEGTDDESDLISTDRQHIDWEDDRVQVFLTWGEALARKVLRECAERRGKTLHDWILEKVEFKTRVDRLDPNSGGQVSKFLKILGQAEPDEERTLELADALIRAYEYRNFHDVISAIEDVEDNPEELENLLSRLSDWRVLESRAILEIIKGRLDIINKFFSMIVNNAPETASKKDKENMHDLLAGYPWLLNPEWQILAEEKSITKQLQEWGTADIPDENNKQRYDFLALAGDGKLVVLEIKRSGYPVELDDLNRLITYKERLAQGNKNISMVMICGGSPHVSENELKAWELRPDGEIRYWNDIHQKTERYYQHYRAILEGDVESPDFFRKTSEVLQTRRDLDRGSIHRGEEARKEGIGPQDTDFSVKQEDISGKS